MFWYSFTLGKKSALRRSQLPDRVHIRFHFLTPVTQTSSTPLVDVRWLSGRGREKSYREHLNTHGEHVAGDESHGTRRYATSRACSPTTTTDFPLHNEGEGGVRGSASPNDYQPRFSPHTSALTLAFVVYDSDQDQQVFQDLRFPRLPRPQNSSDQARADSASAFLSPSQPSLSRTSIMKATIAIALLAVFARIGSSAELNGACIDPRSAVPRVLLCFVLCLHGPVVIGVGSLDLRRLAPCVCCLDGDVHRRSLLRCFQRVCVHDCSCRSPPAPAQRLRPPSHARVGGSQFRCWCC